MKELLQICTQEAPFIHIDGTVYQQIDGIAMGSPLGCIFANFYMSHLENTIIPNLTKAPKLYARYVDDIILIVDSVEELITIKTIFIQNSLLNFTHEIGNHRLAFLDVLLETNENSLTTSVYRKTTNTGELLNYNSECPDKYKTGVIMTMLHN